ncbi:MAG: hypothetical protein IKX36_08200 [Prevotella sp.]|nr:hypothetical protein [Prevotella sp.]
MLVILCVSMVSFSCERQEKRPAQGNATTTVEKFCAAYFNLQYEEALKYCTPESQKWISFAASNISEEDLAVMRNREGGTSIEVTEIDAHDTDTIGQATVKAGNYLSIEKIDDKAYIADEGIFHFDLVKRDGKWKVRMAGLPRNEMRNRD